MESAKNQREVENRLRDALRHDRARVQVGKISRFGLLELSRQRLQPSLEETTHTACPRCHGTGFIRDTASTALHVLRILQEEAMKENTAAIHAQVPVGVATYLLNEKRSEIFAIETRLKVNVLLIPNPHLETPNYQVERLRHDAPQLDAQTPSYELATVPAEEVPSLPSRAAEAKVARPEPLVKGITPDRPAPNIAAAAMPTAPASVARRIETPARAAPPAEEARHGLLDRLFGWLRKPAEPSPTVAQAPVATPAPTPALEERTPREAQRAAAEGRRRDRGEGRRGDGQRARGEGRGEGRQPRGEGQGRGEPREGQGRGEPREGQQRTEGRPPRQERKGEGRPRGEGRGEGRDQGRREEAKRDEAQPASEAQRPPRQEPRSDAEPPRLESVPTDTATQAAEGEGRRRRRGRGRGDRPERADRPQRDEGGAPQAAHEEQPAQAPEVVAPLAAVEPPPRAEPPAAPAAPAPALVAFHEVSEHEDAGEQHRPVRRKRQHEAGESPVEAPLQLVETQVEAAAPAMEDEGPRRTKPRRRRGTTAESGPLQLVETQPGQPSTSQGDTPPAA
jgi:ribonuclease E